MRLKYLILKSTAVLFSVIILLSINVCTVKAEFVKIDSKDYQELAPLPNREGTVSKSVDPIDYLQKLYYFALTICVILAVVMIIIAGVEFTAYGASEEIVSDAKHRITYAIAGLVLALASWLILYVVNPKLVAGDLLLPSNFKVGSGSGVVSGGGGGAGGSIQGDHYGKFYPNEYQAGISNTDLLTKIRDNETAVRNALGPNFSTQYPGDSDGCDSYGNSGCTSVGLLPNSAISRLKTLQQNCACQITINGGTEWWKHDEHGPGRPIIDLNDTSALEGYLRTQGTGNSVVIQGIGSFVNEGDHWHVYLND